MEDSDFGKILRKIRTDAGKTVPEVSAYLTSLGYKAAAQTIYGWERGLSQPNPELFLEMCRFYDTRDVMSAFGYKESPSEAEAAPREENQDVDSLRSTLLDNFDQLNQEGRERLVETSDDMVASGKYKTSPCSKGKTAKAV